jgi:mono/diheme cytochrome c family protein
MRRGWIAAGGIVVAVAATLALWRGGAEATPSMPEDVDVARGAALYADNCASCHGAELEGQPEWRSAGPDGTMPAPPHDATGHTWHHGDALLFEYVLLGGEGAMRKRGLEGVTSAMPAYEGVLSEDEIWDILAFIRSTWPERERRAQAMRTEAERMQGE